jgi:hypothetical protein
MPPRKSSREDVLLNPRVANRKFETATLEEHVALIKRQVDRSLDDDALVRLAMAIALDRPDTTDRRQRRVVRAWGNVYDLPGAPDARSNGTELAEDQIASVRIWNFVVTNWSYIQDPPSFDFFATARYNLDARASADRCEELARAEPSTEARRELLAHAATLRDVKTLGAGDCFPEGTLLLRDTYDLTPVEAIRAGDRIWGDKEWTTIEAAVPKGSRSITAIRLNNGSTLRLTEDHKVYVAICPRHCRRVTTAPCACPQDECQIERIRVADLQIGMRLTQPSRIAFGADDRDPARHYVEGLYLSDGWSEEYRFFISGQDGCPKEAQKREVEAIAKRYGIDTRWHRKYLALNDPEWTRDRIAFMGAGAPNKRAISLNLQEAQARELLRGIMADSSADGGTFTSTSRTLAIQTRVLLRMLGTSCGAAFITDHGGLGKNPIHRLYLRNDGKAVNKRLRVKDIVRGLSEEMTYDLQTTDHKVYLPEHDVTVSNCDDATILLAALHKAAGFKNVRARIVSTDAEYWEHVYTMIGLPRTQSSTFVALDPTVRGAIPGWEYDRARAVHDFIL